MNAEGPKDEPVAPDTEEEADNGEAARIAEEILERPDSEPEHQVEEKPQEEVKPVETEPAKEQTKVEAPAPQVAAQQ